MLRSQVPYTILKIVHFTWGHIKLPMRSDLLPKFWQALKMSDISTARVAGKGGMGLLICIGISTAYHT